MSALLTAALDYAARLHLPVFPCLVRSKEPATKNGFHNATLNPETIRRYWRIQDRNVAVRTGAASGVFVFDTDGDAGAASLRALEAEHGALPRTWTVSTARGWHFYFRYPGGPIPSSVGRIAPGIDVKADGGYCIAPPSVHPSGHIYRWVIPPDGSPAAAPAWLIELARRKPAPPISERALAMIRRPNGRPGAYGSAALEQEIAELSDTAPGGRNHALNRASFKLGQLIGAGELEHRTAVDRLIAAAVANGLVHDDGLEAAHRTIKSGLAAGTRYPRKRGAA